MSFNPAQFQRNTMTKSGVVRSICSRCGRVVGFSPLPLVLELANRAHVCPVAQHSAEEYRQNRCRRSHGRKE